MTANRTRAAHTAIMKARWSCASCKSKTKCYIWSICPP